MFNRLLCFFGHDDREYARAEVLEGGDDSYTILTDICARCNRIRTYAIFEWGEGPAPPCKEREIDNEVEHLLLMGRIDPKNLRKVS